MNQNQRTLNHMIDHGYITQVIAGNYGIRRLASRITDLKQQGVDVISVREKDDAGVPYVKYSLEFREVERNRRDKMKLTWRMAKPEQIKLFVDEAVKRINV